MIRVQITNIEEKRITEYVALQVALAHNGIEAGLLITRVNKTTLEVNITGLQVVFTPQAEGQNHNASNMRRWNPWRGEKHLYKGDAFDITLPGYVDIAEEGGDELPAGDE